MKWHIHRWIKTNAPNSKRRIIRSPASAFGETGPIQYRTCKSCGIEEESWNLQHPHMKSIVWRYKDFIGSYEKEVGVPS